MSAAANGRGPTPQEALDAKLLAYASICARLRREIHGATQRSVDDIICLTTAEADWLLVALELVELIVADVNPAELALKIVRLQREALAQFVATNANTPPEGPTP